MLVTLDDARIIEDGDDDAHQAVDEIDARLLVRFVVVKFARAADDELIERVCRAVENTLVYERKRDPANGRRH